MKLFAISASVRWAEDNPGSEPRISSYVDDVYGGLTGAGGDSFDLAMAFRNYICDTGEKLTLVFNKKPHKTPLPAEQQIILGNLYDSTSRRIKSAAKKVAKYIERINEALEAEELTVKQLMSLHGNLAFAAVVTPFGRPFLSALTDLVTGRDLKSTARITPLAKMGLRIWKQLLIANEDLTYHFVVGRLPRATDDIFFDASTTWGIGSCCGELYFKISWEEINLFFTIDFVARKELLAALVALYCFSSAIKGKLVIAFTDNTNVCD